MDAEKVQLRDDLDALTKRVEALEQAAREAREQAEAAAQKPKPSWIKKK